MRLKIRKNTNEPSFPTLADVIDWRMSGLPSPAPIETSLRNQLSALSPGTLLRRRTPFRGGWGASVAGWQFRSDIYGVVVLLDLNSNPGIASVRQRKHGPMVVGLLGAVDLAGDLAE